MGLAGQSAGLLGGGSLTQPDLAQCDPNPARPTSGFTDDKLGVPGGRDGPSLAQGGDGSGLLTQAGDARASVRCTLGDTWDPGVGEGHRQPSEAQAGTGQAPSTGGLDAQRPPSLGDTVWLIVMASLSSSLLPRLLLNVHTVPGTQ